MAGLFGFSSTNLGHNPEGVLSAAAGLMHHGPQCIDELFVAPIVSSVFVHRGTGPVMPQHTRDAGVFVWLDGEFYNREALARQFDLFEERDCSLLLALYRKDPSFSFMRGIDGFFSAVIYDADRSMIHLVSDRYGLRHLYWHQTSDGIAWGSEVKALLALPTFTPAIDPVAVREFLSIGYILEDRTWLAGVRLLDPGSVLTWNIRERALRMHRYWWWDAIQPADRNVDEASLADELGRLWRAAVERRTRTGTIGLFLSGGLDSRAILAACPAQLGVLEAATFGQPGSLDVQIAAEVARVKGATHYVHELNERTWLSGRMEGVWRTDGMMNLIHLHSTNVPWHLCPINLNGYLGDVVLGGSYLRDSRFLDRPIDEQLAASFLKASVSMSARELDLYRRSQKSDIYGICNRGRKFVALGIRSSMHVRDHRLPFFDNDLIEFIFSLPDRYRYRAPLYRDMLLRTFPEYFSDIPWQRTGLPISASRLQVARKRVTERMRRMLAEVSRPKATAVQQYASYSDWMRKPPASFWIRETLLSRNALYIQYVPRNEVERCLTAHEAGASLAERIGRYMTFELWLQQVFNRRYRFESS